MRHGLRETPKNTRHVRCSTKGMAYRNSRRGLSRPLVALAVAAAATCASPAYATFPSLDQAVALARARAPSVVDARGAAHVAHSLEAGARVAPFGNPYLEVVADRGRFTQDVQVLSSLYLPVEINGQRGARIAEWEQLVGWRTASLAEAQARAVADTADAYGGVLVGSARLAQAERAATEATAEADVFRARLSQGDATSYDLSIAESEASRWAQARLGAQIALGQAHARLAQLIGERPLDPPPAVAAPPTTRAPMADEVAPRWLNESPLLRSLSTEAQYWSGAADRARAERSSPLSVVVTGGRGDLGEARLGAGLAWSFPVFRRNQGEIARAEAERVRVDATTSSLRAALEHRLRSARETYRAAIAGVDEIERTGLPAAERTVDAAIATHRAGKGEITRVLIARRDLAAARARRLDLVELAWRAFADLAAMKGDLP